MRSSVLALALLGFAGCDLPDCNGGTKPTSSAVRANVAYVADTPLCDVYRVTDDKGRDLYVSHECGVAVVRPASDTTTVPASQ